MEKPRGDGPLGEITSLFGQPSGGAKEELLTESETDFFLTSHDHESLLAREKPAYDGAEPSGNSVQALNLMRFHELTTEDRYRGTLQRGRSEGAAVGE